MVPLDLVSTMPRPKSGYRRPFSYSRPADRPWVPCGNPSCTACKGGRPGWIFLDRIEARGSTCKCGHAFSSDAIAWATEKAHRQSQGGGGKGKAARLTPALPALTAPPQGDTAAMDQLLAFARFIGAADKLQEWQQSQSAAPVTATKAAPTSVKGRLEAAIASSRKVTGQIASTQQKQAKSKDSIASLKQQLEAEEALGPELQATLESLRAEEAAFQAQILELQAKLDEGIRTVILVEETKETKGAPGSPVTAIAAGVSAVKIEELDADMPDASGIVVPDDDDILAAKEELKKREADLKSLIDAKRQRIVDSDKRGSLAASQRDAQKAGAEAMSAAAVVAPVGARGRSRSREKGAAGKSAAARAAAPPTAPPTLPPRPPPRAESIP